MEGPLAGARSPETGHRPGWLWTERSAGRIQKKKFRMVQAMLDRIDTTTIRSLFNLQVVAEESPEEIQRRRLAARRRGGSMQVTGPNQGATAAGEEAGKTKTVVRDHPKVGRNDPCPCGSGKKYKKCHGAAL